MRCKRTALITLLLLVGLVLAGGLWLRSEQRQYRLNRQLIAALVKGDKRQAFILVEAGADPNTRYEPTPVPSLPEPVKHLLRHSPPINNSPTAFMIVCGTPWQNDDWVVKAQQNRPDDARLVPEMLTHGANVNLQADLKGCTPLVWAAISSNPQTVLLLLEHGAKVNVYDITVMGIDGCTPLMLGASLSHTPDTVRQLLNSGADVNAQTKDGLTALMCAVSITGCSPSNHVKMVRLLLEHGASVNTQDKDGESALHNAMQGGGDKSIVGLLLAHGADPNLADKTGGTPLTMAQFWHLSDAIALIRHVGARK